MYSSLTRLQQLAKASQPTLLLTRNNPLAIALCHIFLNSILSVNLRPDLRYFAPPGFYTTILYKL